MSEGRPAREGNPGEPERIRQMFDRISGAYDAMNAVISGFQEPRWRRRLVREARLRAGMRAIDVATGTGKVAIGLWEAVQPGGDVLGIDFAPRMIDLARRRARDRPGLAFEVADALALPVEDASFDAATIAFGLRNLTDYRRGLDEMRRAVRPGGRVVCLEVARPRSRAGRLVQTWFDNAIPLIGRLVGHGDAYAYLVRSSREYPSPERIAALMGEVGLTDVRWFAMTGGIVTIHVATWP